MFVCVVWGTTDKQATFLPRISLIVSIEFLYLSPTAILTRPLLAFNALLLLISLHFCASFRSLCPIGREAQVLIPDKSPMDNKLYSTFKDVGRKEFGDVVEIPTESLMKNRYVDILPLWLVFCGPE